MSMKFRSRRLRGAVRGALEQLEARRMLNAVAWSLNTQGVYTQDWESYDFTTANDWSGINHVEGFTRSRNPNVLNINIGPDGTNASRLEEVPLSPAGTTGNGTRVYRLIVNSNVTTPGGSTTGFTDGGPREMNYSAGAEVTGVTAAGKTVTTGSRTIALQSSDTDRDDAYLKFYVDNTGKTTPVRVRYDLLDVDTEGNTNSAARQSFALQYRIGTTGDFAYVEGSYIHNAADFTAGATGLAHSVDVVLPPDTVGASGIELRLLTVNTQSTDQLVAVENFTISNADTPGVLAFASTDYIVDEGAGNVTITVRRTAGAVGAISVNYDITNITTTNADYAGTGGVLNFANNEAVKTIVIPIVNDTISEGPEQFRVTLSNPTNGSELGPIQSTVVTIIDNDSTAPAIGSIMLNEIAINPSDDDQPGEYIEIRGTPGMTLNNVAVLAIEGDRTNATAQTAGLVDLVFDLSGYTIGSNGLLIIKSDQTTFNIPAATTVVTSPLFNLSGGIVENGTNTFALVYNPMPYIVGTDLFNDLDEVNGATLEFTPGTVALDIVGFYDTFEGSGTNDRAFGAIVYGFGTTSVTDVMDAITRLPTDNTVTTAVTPVPNAPAWYGANLIDPDPVNAGATDVNGVVYSVTPGQFSANKPAGAIITPGAPNYPNASITGLFTFATTRYSADEEWGGVTVTVVRAGNLTGSASVSYATLTTGTATPNVDFTPVSGTLTFANGESEKTFFIPYIDDSDGEGAETIEIALSNPTNGHSLVGPGTARATINKSDSVQPVGLLINEILTNAAGDQETPAEYLELIGTPNTTLVDVYLISVEGDGANDPGIVTAVMNLTGAKIGSNGLLLVTSNILGEGFAPEDPNTGVFGVSNYSSSGSGLQSNTNTFLLVYIPQGFDPPVLVPVSGTDYYTPTSTAAHRGTLEFDPETIILDSIAYYDGGATDVWFSDAVLVPPPAYTGTAYLFGGATRFPGNTTPNSADAFFYGSIGDAYVAPGMPINLSKRYSATVGTQRSANFPAGAQRFTPGGFNQPFATDSTYPTVTSAVFVPGTQSVVVTFSEAVRPTYGSSFDGTEFLLTHTTTSTTVTLSVKSVSPDNTTVTLGFVNTGGVKGSTVPESFVLLDGNYTIRATMGRTMDFGGPSAEWGNYLNAHSTTPFQFKNADFNGDLSVNFSDLLVLAQNYGKTTGATFAQGDANFDGAVNFEDLLILAQKYGTALPASIVAALTGQQTAADSKSTPLAPRKPTFGSTLIG